MGSEEAHNVLARVVSDVRHWYLVPPPTNCPHCHAPRGGDEQVLHMNPTEMRRHVPGRRRCEQCGYNGSYYIQREWVEEGIADPPRWWQMHRYVYDRDAWEVGNLAAVLRWWSRAVFVNFARYCVREAGMPRPVAEGSVIQANEFCLAFWRWCQPRRTNH